MPDYRVTYQLGGLGKQMGLAALSAQPQLSPPPAKIPPGYFSGGWPMPVLTSDMLFKDHGVSGLRQFGGWVREEFLPQLQGRQAARTYREMLDNSAIVGAVIFAIRASLRKVDWRVEPADDTPPAAEMAEFAESMMSDMSHTWSEFIDEAQSKLGYGFAPMEIVYKRRNGREPGPDPQRPGKSLAKSDFDDGYIAWKKLALRGQDTVIKWFFGEAGQILGLTQQPWIGALVDIPIEKLLLFRPTQWKNNPEGRSILRTAYRAYYLSKRMEELEAIAMERFGGLPLGRIPNEVIQMASAGDPNALSVVQQWKNIVTNVRVDEQMGLLLPSDRWPGKDGNPSPERMYEFELVTPAARQSVDSDKAITRYNINIMTSVLADFLQLGHEARGTQSLAVSKVDMFFQAIEGYLNSDADVINRHGLSRVWDLNGFDNDLKPDFAPDLAQRIDLDVLSNYILRLSQAGMPLFPDPDLENWARDAAGMPDVTDEQAFAETGMNQPAADPNAPPPTGQQAEQQHMARKRLEDIVRGSIMRRLVKYNGHTSVETRARKKTRKVISPKAIAA